MMDEPQAADPLQALIRLMVRTLRMIYGGFWISLAVYAAVLLAIPWLIGDVPSGSSGLRHLPAASWGRWQFLFVAIAIAAVYVSLRLRARLLDPRRLRRGAQSLFALAEQLRPEKGVRDSQTDRLGRAVQELLGRALSAYVVLWMLVEIPAVLGVIDRMISGDLRIFSGLAVLSAIGLLLQRPSRERIREMLGPLAG